MDNPAAYIPIDRRQALARGESLSERTTGAALFADISGFTPLSKALTAELGPRRGAEELSFQMNRVYDALVNQLHQYRGSVIGFSGDAITCWLDGDDGRRAVATALAMQDAMRKFEHVRTRAGFVTTLTIKVAVTAGPVRRFIVGQPDYALMDIMAGRTLLRLAATEHQASSGEIVLDGKTADALSDDLHISDWRESDDHRYAVVTGLNESITPTLWPLLAPDALDEEQLRVWLLPRIYERLQSGQGEFIAELRPATSLFIRFGGIDYDNDPEAPQKLDHFVRQVEQIFARYDGSITHLTLGDKGSYFCTVFGAPVSHEDDGCRVGAAALDVLAIADKLDCIGTPQMGITQGRMWCGAYGSSTRRTYDVLGDVVNLSARLMMAAKPGQILATDAARDNAPDDFIWQDLPPIHVKGVVDKVNISNLIGRTSLSSDGLRVDTYSLPMVGRTEELERIDDALKLGLTGKGQIIGLTGEAGVGKSRLAAEVIRLADQHGYIGLGGECQSYGSNTSYLPWHNIWRCFFGLDSSMRLQEQISHLEGELSLINPSLVDRLPLLGPVLNLSIPDNDLTQSLVAKVRKSSLEGMLLECLRWRTGRQPLLLVLEDTHWLDPLSRDLIELIGRAIVDQPSVMLLLYRPPEHDRQEAPQLDHLDYFQEFRLGSLSHEEAEQLIHLKLDQFFGAESNISPDIYKLVIARAAGNPFYIEELLNYLNDLGIDPADSEAIVSIDLPDSVHSLILSRMDQLTHGQQVAIKVASVIGRLFRVATVWGAYPQLGAEEQVRADLDSLRDLDITLLDSPEPELTYLFKHVFTQQVIYESLLYATRSRLHNAIGEYIEAIFADDISPFLYILAHHYEHSENEEKQRFYLLKAGELAQREYANQAAIEYFTKVIPLLPIDQQADVTLQLGQVQELIGSWDEAAASYDQARSLAIELDDLRRQAWVETTMAEFLRKQGDFNKASAKLDHAQTLFEQIDDQAGLGQVLHRMGSIADQRGKYEQAQSLMHQSLEIRQQIGDQRQAAYLLGNMGIVARRQGDLNRARALYEESLSLRQTLNDRWGVANILNNLGNLLLDFEDLVGARQRLQEAVAIHRQLGDRWAIGNALNNLANVLRMSADYTIAQRMYRESLSIYRELGDKWALAYLFEDVAWLAALQNNGRRGLILSAAGSVLREQINAPLTSREAEKLDAALAPATRHLSESLIASAKNTGQSMNLEGAIDFALNELGLS